MFFIEMWLLVLMIGFLFAQIYPFQQTKLKKGKYHEYGFWIILCTGVCMYFGEYFLQENHWQNTVKISSAIFTTGFSIACFGKQFLYDYRQSKLPFQRK